MRSAPLWQHEQTHVAVRPPPGKTSGQPPFVTPADTKRARWFSGALGSAAAIALFAMMVLTFADVFSRKFLGNSINGAVELTELCMLVMIFAALPLASSASEHVVFDLLDRALPVRWLRWQAVLSQTLTALVFGAASWVVWRRSERTWEMGDVTARLEIHLGPFHQFVAAMLVLTAAIHLVLAARAVVSYPRPATPGGLDGAAN